MKLSLGICTCRKCELRTELPFLHPFTYGEFLLWSEDGECRYLCALNDSAFSEVADLVGQLVVGETLSGRAHKIHSIFGSVACDRSTEGFTVEMHRLPRCSQCGECFVVFDGYVDPVVIVDIETHAASHVEWNGFTAEEKLVRVAAALREIGSA